MHSLQIRNYSTITQAPVPAEPCPIAYTLSRICPGGIVATHSRRTRGVCAQSHLRSPELIEHGKVSFVRRNIDPNLQVPGCSRREVLGSLGVVPAGLLALPALLPSVTASPPAQAAASGLRAPNDAELVALRKALKKVVEQPKAPVLLRLPFHDAGTFSMSGGGNGGANASVRFELDRPENSGLKRGWRVIEQLAKALEGTSAASTVSLADLVFLAGAYAVQLCNGPEIQLRVGRPDAASPDPEGRLPSENASSAQLKAVFADKGFSAQELVALSGAHTVGGKGFGAPYSFDNTYYKELLKKPWTNTKDSMASMIGLPSDHVLPDDPELQPVIQEYAGNQEAFFRDFSNAYLKLSELGVQGA